LLSSRAIEIPQRLGETDVRRVADGLAGSLPRLMAEARRAAATVVAGLHGRRKAGQGETFWQFRPFQSGEGASRVDWRRSARDDHLYVREREWEAAQAIHIFIDRSGSMDYRSQGAAATKGERAIVLGLALADMLVRGGERVALMGVMKPTASRRIIDKLSDAMLLHSDFGREWPRAPLPPRSEAVLISDFIAPLDELTANMRALAGHGARGQAVLVSDPAEESFPFHGQTEFVDPEGGFRLRLGEAGAVKALYAERLAAHREGLARIASGLGWGFQRHVTDGAASAALLALSMSMSAGGAPS
jgi:uncharacterized protein (DUF58 family)